MVCVVSALVFNYILIFNLQSPIYHFNCSCWEVFLTFNKNIVFYCRCCPMKKIYALNIGKAYIVIQACKWTWWKGLGTAWRESYTAVSCSLSRLRCVSSMHLNRRLHLPFVEFCWYCTFLMSNGVNILPPQLFFCNKNIFLHKRDSYLNT